MSYLVPLSAVGAKVDEITARDHRVTNVDVRFAPGWAIVEWVDHDLHTEFKVAPSHPGATEGRAVSADPRPSASSDSGAFSTDTRDASLSDLRACDVCGRPTNHDLCSECEARS